MPGARVEIRSLRKSFELGGRVIDVLRGIDLTIDAGDMLSVLGLSGAGKSTLLHLMGTLDAPTAGDVLYDGVSTATWKPAQLADFRNRTIGFVFQFHHLLPEFSAEENCAMPALIGGVPESQARRLARDLLARVGLSERLDHRPGELSGGEQQRVALARALVRQPRVLLADEPTGNLDSHTGQEIHDLIVELNRELGMTMMVVTHNREFAKRMPRQLEMIDGKLGGPAVPDAAIEQPGALASLHD